MIKVILPLILFFIVETFFYHELFLTALISLIATIDLHITKYKYIKLFTFGLIIGTFIELFLGQFSRQQYWQNTILFPIPLWLPLIWGYGFVTIHRIGNILDN
ncbi:hypothetical protein KBC75_03755 [Candidatus Shapirobacteria bacterium]|nr:hypothetical protein [Candidatus Shapirobacteria bacterium]